VPTESGYVPTSSQPHQQKRPATSAGLDLGLYAALFNASLSNDPLQEMFHAILDRGAAPEQAIEEMVIKLRTMMEETRAAR